MLKIMLLRWELFYDCQFGVVGTLLNYEAFFFFVMNKGVFNDASYQIDQMVSQEAVLPQNRVKSQLVRLNIH